jgi:RES domain-containing protein
LNFEGRVWRHVPAGAHPLDFAHLITAKGRWNRRGQYGCLYTALTADVAIAEYAKAFTRFAISEDRDLVALEVRIGPVYDLQSTLEQTETRLTARGGEIAIRLSQNDPRVVGDTEDDLELCRTVADAVREHGHYAIRAPSAAQAGGSVLAMYPENRPDHIRIQLAAPRLELNYGPDPLIDCAGELLRPLP